MSVNPPIAHIYRNGQSREIEPVCRSLRRTLQTLAHIAAWRAEQSLNVFAVPLLLYDELEVTGKPGLVCWAGWEPVVHKLLLDEGFKVETIGFPRRPLPRPDLGRLQRHGFVDSALLDCLRQRQRALIRYSADNVDPVHLTVQIALAWPKQKIAVVATRIGETRQVRDRLRGFGIDAVAVNSRNAPPEVGQVAVCTPAGLSHVPVQVEWLDIVIVLDALEIISKVGMECIAHAARARMFGLIEAGAQAAPLERDFMTGLFGFHELVIPRHGHRERGVQVLRYAIRGGPRLPSKLDVLMAKRLGLWHHALRNRKIAQVASAFRENRLDHIEKMFTHGASSLVPSTRGGVVILVENIEHALALSRRLPGWLILTGLEVCKDGLPAEQAKKVRPVCPFGEPNPLYAIVTAAGMGALVLSAIGVLVRADGGVGLPSLTQQALAEPAMSVPRPLLLIDFHDRHHPLLRRWSRQRQDAYTERGWYAPGVDPVQARVEQFLASRREGRSR
jgi:hypothetical protein